MNPKLAYRIEEAADLTPYSHKTLRRAIQTVGGVGDDGVPLFPPPLRAKRDSRGYVILAADLDAWLQSLPDA